MLVRRRRRRPAMLVVAELDAENTAIRLRPELDAPVGPTYHELDSCQLGYGPGAELDAEAVARIELSGEEKS